MKHTQFVLNETEFFLTKLKEETDRFPNFNYYLNAYINAARSVLWIMKHEYGQINGWREWYDSTEVDNDLEQLLKGIVDMRNRSLKQSPLQIKKEYLIGNDNTYFNLFNEIIPFVGKKVSLTIEQTNEIGNTERIKSDNSLTLKGKLKSIYSVEEFENKDVLDICQQYFDWLKEHVNLCIEKFG